MEESIKVFKNPTSGFVRIECYEEDYDILKKVLVDVGVKLECPTFCENLGPTCLEVDD